MASRLTAARRLARAHKISSFPKSLTLVREASVPNVKAASQNTNSFIASRKFSSPTLNLNGEGPAPIDYHSLLQEGEFHKLADSTIHDLQEKLEEYVDGLDIDGADIDYGNEVLTVKLGDLGTYVLNKQTPNRQLWLSSPASGPSRFDWDKNAEAWVYRRTKANLLVLLESELEQLCGKPFSLS